MRLNERVLDRMEGILKQTTFFYLLSLTTASIYLISITYLSNDEVVQNEENEEAYEYPIELANTQRFSTT